jgi:predicted nuclease of predicted toxin-antitoxin system
MIRFLLDENFNGKIVRGLRARQPDVDMLRVQDTELSGEEDPTVLEWAAKEGRILPTHDLDTMTKYANERIVQGLPLAGVIFVRDTLPVAKVIDDLLAILGASEASEWEKSHLPLLPEGDYRTKFGRFR